MALPSWSSEVDAEPAMPVPVARSRSFVLAEKPLAGVPGRVPHLPVTNVTVAPSLALLEMDYLAAYAILG